MSINNVVNSKIGSGINKFVKWSPVSKFLEEGVKDPASFAAKMMVTSLISKDAVNCIIYTTQSANNKRIPEDKRGFNAFLDLFNGILNVGGQIISYCIVDSVFTPKWFGKSFSARFKDPHSKQTTNLEDKYGAKAIRNSKFSADNISDLVKTTIDGVVSDKPADKTVPNYKIINRIQEMIKNQKEAITNMNPEQKEALIKKITEEFKEGGSRYKSVEKGFSLVVGALATTALVKRTLVPLIATPLAGKMSDIQAARKADKKQQQQENIINTVNDPNTKLANNKINKIA